MKITDFILDLIFPNRCGFCDDFIAWDKLACDECINQIEFTNDYIRKDFDGNFTVCISCVSYEGTAKEGLLNLKYHKGFNTAKYLLPSLVKRLENVGITPNIDLVTCIPMNSKRLDETGYNHAEVIAKILAKSLGVSHNFKILGKNKSTNRQHDLTRAERLEAVKGSYYLKTKFPDIKGKTILICDDIITTGATLSECSRLLLQAGAKEVYCATLGTTFLKEGSDVVST